MLIRSVRLKLQRGELQTMSAEQYDSATVYFSDVSNFAELSSSHNPIQIVAILNEIYKYVVTLSHCRKMCQVTTTILSLYKQANYSATFRQYTS